MPVLVLSLLLVAASAATGTAPSAALASNSPEPLTADAAAAWLDGPFGRVPGSLLANADASLVEVGRPLDTVVRRARLYLEPPLVPGGLHAWRVSSRSDADGTVEALATGPSEGEPTGRGVQFRGPDAPGGHVLLAELDALDGTRHVLGWRLLVPDTPSPPDGIPDLEPVGIELASSAGSVRGQPGNGCYVYDCVDIGDNPPLASLPQLGVVSGETLAVRLTDGSPPLAWTAESTSSAGEVVQAAAEHEGSGSLADLTAPGPGTWLTTVRVVFDRERGWFEGWFLLRSR